MTYECYILKFAHLYKLCFNTYSINNKKGKGMSVQAIKKEKAYVDPYTAELFASYENVGTDLNFDELEAIADLVLEANIGVISDEIYDVIICRL